MIVPLLGLKSEMMLQQLNQGLLKEWKEGKIHYQNVSYHVLTGKIEEFITEPLACVGANPLGREIILLDPKNAPLLEQRYCEWISQREFSWKSLIFFMHTIVFGRNGTLVERGFVPLDHFIEQRVGNCRHYAFVTAYFLNRLSQEGKIAPGKSYYVRDLVADGGHAWNLFILDDGSSAWHLDTYWDIAKDLNKPDDFNYLLSTYGPKAIWNEKNRFINTKML